MAPESSNRPALSSPAHAVRYTESPRRVLVVEDNLDSVRALAELVRDIGHHVEYAINGYAALMTAQRLKPHFVLLDLGLPGMDGFELCGRLKREPGLGAPRVIAITAYARDDYRVRALAAGCELHLVKPVSPQTLFEVLESTAPGGPGAPGAAEK
jgi:CheY-like chemotaxis protein